jgi:adenylate cyclase
MNDSDFTTALAGWVKGFCEERAREDWRKQRSSQIHAEIAWTEKEIQKLANQYDKRPSVIHQINEYHHQIRQRELTLVFLVGA